VPAYLPDLLLVVFALSLIAAYHGWLLRRIRTRPMTTAVGLTRHIRKQWAEMVMAERRDVLAGVFLFAFFNFAQALRYFNHAGFQIALPPGQDSWVTPQGVADGVNGGGLHYTLGMRGYYRSVPLAL
jgi:hypothetical protein